MKSISSILVSSIIALIAVFYFHDLETHEKKQRYLAINLRTSIDSAAQVFYDIGKGYSEHDSSRVNYWASAEPQTIILELPNSAVSHLRFDPSEKASHEIFIHSIEIIDGTQRSIHRFDLEQIQSFENVSFISYDPGLLHLSTSANSSDPQIYIPLADPLPLNESWESRNTFSRMIEHLLVALVSFGIAFTIFQIPVSPFVQSYNWIAKKMISFEYPTNPKISSNNTTKGLWLILGGVAIFNLFAFLVFSSHYFFLLDDFQVLDTAQKNTWLALFTEAHIGFYRPLVFVFFKIQILLFGWEAPGWHSFVSIILHSVNSFLVGILSHKIFRNKLVAAFSAVLFLINPWSGESPLWFCLQSDLLAVTGSLIVLILGSNLKEDNWKTLKNLCVIPFLLFLSSLFAYLGKESVLTLPAIYGLFLCLNNKLTKLLRSPLLYVNFAAITLSLILYMLLRSNQISAFGGAYGNYFDLIKDSNPYYLIHPFFIPALSIKTKLIYSWIQPIHFLLMSGAILSCLVFRPRSFLLLILAFFFALLPIMNFEIPINSSSGTRWLYLPSVVISILVTNAVYLFLKSEIQKSSKLSQSLFLIVPITYLTILTLYVGNQRHIWKRASDISRSCIEQFAEVKDKGTHFYIPNIPHQFEEGSVMIASHCFNHYFHDNHPLYIRGRWFLLQDKENRIEVTKRMWDRYSGYSENSDEIVFFLDYDKFNEPNLEKN